MQASVKDLILVSRVVWPMGGKPDRRITLRALIVAYLRGQYKGNEEFQKNFHSQSLLLMGFLGGITLATLVVVLQAEPLFNVNVIGLGDGYFGFLIGSLAFASFLSITTAAANLMGAVFGPFENRFTVFTIVGIDAVVVMFCYFLPLLLLPFIPWYWCVVLFALNVTLLATMLCLAKMMEPPPSYPDELYAEDEDEAGQREPQKQE